MLKIVKRKDIDIKKWDNIVANSTSFSIYGLSWYLDSVCEWDALIYADYQYILPIPNNRKLILKSVYMPLGIQYFDIYSIRNVEKEVVVKFIKKLKSKFVKFDISLNRQFDIPIIKVSSTIRLTQVLNLYDKYENIYSCFSTSHKRNIKKGEKNNLSIKKIKFTKDVERCLVDFYKEKKLNRSKFLTEYFNLIHVLEKKSLIDIKGVYNLDNVLQNISIFTNLGGDRIGLNSINVNEGSKNGAMFFCFNNFVEENSNSNIILDFEGSNIESIRRRNLGFGAVDESYKLYSYSKL